jgi:hypothetical protein
MIKNVGERMIRSDEEWISICRLDDDNDLCFTEEYLSITKGLSGHSRKFASQLISHWLPEFCGLLDYFGPSDEENDKFSGIDGEKMDIRADIMDVWEYKDLPLPGLDAEWHSDILRSKLVTIKLPRRLIEKYMAAAKKKLLGD